MTTKQTIKDDTDELMIMALIKLNKSLVLLDDLVGSLVSPNEPSAEHLTKFALYLFVHKTYWSLKSSQLILNHFHSNYNHALGLVFRSILTDYFLIMNIRFNANSIEEIESAILSYFKDDEKKTDAHVDLMEDKGLHSSDEIAKARENLNHESHLAGFIRSKEPPQIKLPMLTTDIFKTLIDKRNLQPNDKKMILSAFDLWKLYSQYEHFGLRTIEVTRNVSEEKFDSRAVSILMFSLVSIRTCLTAIGKHEEKQKLADFQLQEI